MPSVVATFRCDLFTFFMTIAQSVAKNNVISQHDYDAEMSLEYWLTSHYREWVQQQKLTKIREQKDKANYRKTETAWLFLGKSIDYKYI